MSTTIHDYEYLYTMQQILNRGEKKDNRTGVPTIGTFGEKMQFDLQFGFPLLTSKKVHFPSIVWELLWFIRGETNVKWLQEHGVTIWDEWADAKGDLGPVYGSQWRSWPAYRHSDVDEGLPDHDQLRQVIRTLKTNPNDRRLIVSAWNVGLIHEMKLPPCHLLFQFYVRNKRFLDCQLYQRSCDFFLGVPFNIASYALLMHIVAHLTNLDPGIFKWIGGDCHVYENHREQVKEQLSRPYRPSPTLRIRENAPTDIDADWGFEHFELLDYNPHPPIRAKVAV